MTFCVAISISFTFILVPVYAKSKIYENTDYRIRVQYPNNWEASEEALPAHSIVMFEACTEIRICTKNRLHQM